MLAVQEAPVGGVTMLLLEPGALADVAGERRRSPHTYSYLKHIPRTVAECDQMRAIINSDVTDIQLQLKDEARIYTMELAAFLDWERRAKKALIYKQAQLRELKLLRHELNQQVLPASGPRSEATLLRRCADMFNRLRDDGVDFSPAEEAFIDILADMTGTPGTAIGQ